MSRPEKESEAEDDILDAMPVLLAAAGFLLVGLDGSVNIAFPALSAAFGVGPTTIRWVIICYVGTYALTAFAAGRLAWPDPALIRAGSPA